MKRQEGKLKDRRAKRDSGDVPTDRRGKREEEEPEEAGNGDDIREEPAPKKNKRLDEQKEKKKTRKGWIDFLHAVANDFHSPELISHLCKSEVKAHFFVLTTWQHNETHLQTDTHQVSIVQHCVALLETWILKNI